MTVSADGFLIDCRSCKKPFVSKGLRCCSPECERQYRERETIAATMAEVQAESTGYVHRKCEQCGGNIPRYTGTGLKRRETAKNTRFYSRLCGDRFRSQKAAAAES
jgi:DNA-directed RNA polymerase subunit M/transcription elongation factor TFIIS